MSAENSTALVSDRLVDSLPDRQDHGRRRAWLLFVIRRVVFVPIAAGIAASLAFLLVHLIGANPGAVIAGQAATPERVQEINTELGLTAPLTEQYWSFISKLLQGDLGNSYYSHNSVISDMGQHLVSTLELIVPGILLAMLIGTALGLVAGTARSVRLRGASRFVVSLLQSVPDFLVGLILILVFFSVLGWAPSPAGQVDIQYLPPPVVTGSALFDGLIAGDGALVQNALAHLVLPVLTLGLAYGVFFAKFTEAISSRAASSGAIEFARAQGLRMSAVRRRILRMSRNERLVTVGLLLSGLIGGDALVEKIFAWGGYGSFIVDRIIALDLPEIQGFVVLSGTLTVIVFGVVDVITMLRDPRVAERALAPRTRRGRGSSAPAAHHASRPASAGAAADAFVFSTSRRPGLVRIDPLSTIKLLPRGGARLLRSGVGRLGREPVAAIALGLVAALLLVAFFLPLPHDSNFIDTGATLQPPSGEFWFGTDSVGRDVLSRCIAAARVDIPLALAGAGASFALGSLLGLLASELRVVGGVIMRVLDVFQALPLVVLAIVVVVLSGNNLGSVVVAIMLFGVPQFIRITKTAADSVQSQRFVEAARATGASRLSVLIREVLPNIGGVLIGQMSLTVAQGILVIASLSFLGVGIRPPTSSWGAMLQAGSQNLVSGQWWPLLFPALALLLVVWCFNQIGSRLESRLNSGWAS